MNYAVSLLKIVCCYAVVSIHFGRTVPGANISVPLFVLFAMYYYRNDGQWLTCKNRIIRLLQPYLFWGCVGLVVDWLLSSSITCRKILMQLFAGGGVNGPLYFLLLVSTYTGIVYFLRRHLRNFLFVVALLGVCFLFQYAGINDSVSNRLPYPANATVGRFVELLPFALVGAYYQTRRVNVSLRIQTVVALCCVGLAVGMKYFGLLCAVGGFAYGGVQMCLVSVGIGVLALSIGETRLLLPDRLKSAITFVARLTPGVFFCHFLVGKLVAPILPLDGPMLTFVVFVTSAVLIFCLGRIKYINRFVQ